MDCSESFVDFETKKSNAVRRTNAPSKRVCRKRKSPVSISCTGAKTKQKEPKKHSPIKGIVAVVTKEKKDGAVSNPTSENIKAISSSEVYAAKILSESEDSRENEDFCDFKPSIISRANTYSHLLDKNSFNEIQSQEIHNISSVIDSSSLDSQWSCVACKEFVTMKDRNVHFANCIKMYQHKGVKKRESLEESSTSDFICDICKKDISHFTFEQRCDHMNRCLDSVEDVEVEPVIGSYSPVDSKEVPSVKTVVITDCPLCLKNCSSAEARLLHIKKCSSAKGIDVQSVLTAIQLQAQHAAERMALGLPLLQTRPPAAARSSVNTKLPKRLREPKSKMDGDLQLAKALSLSEEDQKKRQVTNDTDEFDFANDALSVSIQLEPPQEGQKPGKKRKKNMSKQVPFLVLQTDEGRRKLLEERVSAIVESLSPTKEENEEENITESTPGFLLKRTNNAKCLLWSHCGLAEDKSSYYVSELAEFVTPSYVEPGSKLHSLSQVPGYCIYTQQPCDYTFTATPKDRMSSDSQVKIPSTQEMLDVIISQKARNDEIGNLTSATSSVAKLNLASQNVHEGLASDGFFEKENGIVNTFNPVIQSLESLVGNMWLSDVDIRVADGESIPAHKLLLLLRCPALRHELGTCHDTERLTLDWSSVSRESVWHFLFFTYTGCKKWPMSLNSELSYLALRNGIQDSELFGIEAYCEKTRNSCLDVSYEDISHTMEDKTLDSNVICVSSNNFEEGSSNMPVAETAVANMEKAQEEVMETDCDKEVAVKGGTSEVVPYCTLSELHSKTNNIACTLNELNSSAKQMESDVDLLSETSDVVVEEDYLNVTEVCSPEAKLNSSHLSQLQDREIILSSPDLFVCSSDDEVGEDFVGKTPICLRGKKLESSPCKEPNKIKPDFNANISNSSIQVCKFHSFSSTSPENIAFSIASSAKNEVIDEEQDHHCAIMSERSNNALALETVNKLFAAQCVGYLSNPSQNFVNCSLQQNSYSECTSPILIEDDNDCFNTPSSEAVYHDSKGSVSPTSKQNSFSRPKTPDKSASSYNHGIVETPKIKFLHMENKVNKLADTSFPCRTQRNNCVDDTANCSISTGAMFNADDILTDETTNTENYFTKLWQDQSAERNKFSDPFCLNASATSFHNPEHKDTDIEEVNYVSQIVKRSPVEWNCDSPIVLSSDDDISMCEERLQVEEKTAEQHSFVDNDAVFTDNVLVGEHVSASKQCLESPKQVSLPPSPIGELDVTFEDEIELMPLHMRIAGHKTGSSEKKDKPVLQGSTSSNISLGNENGNELASGSQRPSGSLTLREEKAIGPSTSCKLSEVQCEKKVKEPTADNNNEIRRCPTVEYKITESPITPMPNYKNMITPEIKVALKKFGLRHLPRKKAVSMLTHIYDETHPWIEVHDGTTQEKAEFPVQEFSEIKEMSRKRKNSISGKDKTKGKKKLCPKQNDKKKDLNTKSQKSSCHSVVPKSSSVDAASQEISSSQTSSQSDLSDMPEESILALDDDDVESSQPQEVECNSKRGQLLEYIQCNMELYSKVLMYEPLNLAEFHQELKENGIKVSSAQLMDFLDEECITFTVPRSEKYKKRQQSRNQKFRKRVIAKLSQQNTQSAV